MVAVENEHWCSFLMVVVGGSHNGQLPFENEHGHLFLRVVSGGGGPGVIWPLA